MGDGSQIFYSEILDLDVMPKHHCFHDEHCSHGSLAMHNSFKSVASWQMYFSESEGLSVSGGYAQVSASVSASLGTSMEANWTDERQSLYSTFTNRQACYIMNSDCLYNASYLSSGVKKFMAPLPTDSRDQSVLELWSSEFIKRYGSHVNVASQHGAELRVLTTMSTQCKSSTKDLQSNTCESVKFLSYLDESFCSNVTHSATTSECETQSTLQCVAVGGDGQQVSSQLCGDDVDARDLQDFLTSGDMTQGSSTISYKFMKFADMLHFMGYTEQAVVLDKAAEYHACQGPRWKWARGSDGEYGCQCAISCGSGGSLNADACTCHCKGDVDHGFKGADCSETYGTCQPGVGTGNSDKAGTCRITGTCGDDVCSPTDNCCATDFGSTCCPYGTTCNCGAWNCKCVESLSLV